MSDWDDLEALEIVPDKAMNRRGQVGRKNFRKAKAAGRFMGKGTRIAISAARRRPVTISLAPVGAASTARD